MLIHEKEINSRSRILFERLVVVVQGVRKFLALHGIQTFFTTREQPASGPCPELKDSTTISGVLTDELKFKLLDTRRHTSISKPT